MDALAQLALMSKAKLVFESPGTFLSFPALSPVSYKANDLKFDPANMTPARLLVLSEFSRLANSRPAGTIFQMDFDSYLWDTYQQILHNAILARDLAKAEDTAAFNAAVALLTATDANGFVTDSVQMSTYRQYRDASFKAAEDYTTQLLTAQASTDPAAQTQWTTIDEPRLRTLKQQAEDDWRSKGFKDQIERALQIQQAHAANSPQTTWRQWSSLFDPSIDIQTDTNTQEFALTSYAPQGIFDQDWPTFHLTRDEINQLAQQAPAELRDIFAIEGASSTVEALSFEYRSVALTRPWFKSAIFDARFWRQPDGSTPLSDGGNPPQGAWPAYATALVFVRNISLTLRGSPAGQAGPPEPVRAGSLLMLDRAMLRSPAVFVRRPVASVEKTMPPPVIRDHRQMNVRDHRTIAMARPNVMFARPAMTVAPLTNAAVFSRLSRTEFTTLPVGTVGTLRPLPPPPPPPTTTPNTTTQQGTRDDVSVLALICKRLPKCPNPDPGLTW